MINSEKEKKHNTGIISMEGIQNLDILSFMNSDRYPFLLESCPGKKQTASSDKTSRYDILFAFPGERLVLNSMRLLSGHCHDHSTTFLDALDAWWQENKKYGTCISSDLPFRGGWFLFLSYELAEEIEPILQLPESKNNFPKAIAVRIPAAVINDHKKNKSYIISENSDENILNEIRKDLEKITYAEYSEIEIIRNEAVASPVPIGAKSETSVSNNTPLKDAINSGFILTEEPEEKYLSSCEKAIEYIHAGDVFQVNLSRSWRTSLSENISTHQIYRSLKNSNPAPFTGMALFPEGNIISSSPERLIEVRKNKIETRPIAGTRPRTSEEQSNIEEKIYLKTNPKELSEHRMLIDLERNDLGKICIPGSVAIDENMIVEEFAHVYHIVSAISGILADGITPGKIIRSIFPGGTITGCPKIRCMQIISELEKEARGPYTGSMGYLNSDGDMDLNILIRTFFRNKTLMEFRAGAGIVADSIPLKELEETRSKAKGLILAMKNL